MTEPGRETLSDEGSVRRFRRASEAAGHAIFITDVEGRIEYVNPTFEEMTGYSAAEAIGETPRILKSGEMSAAYYEELWETILAGEVWEAEIVNRRKDGEYYHADQTIAPITDGVGDVEGFVAIQSDITDRVETERELQTFEEIVNRIEDPIMLQDLDGTFRIANDAVTAHAGVSEAELLGADEFAFMDKETAARIERMKRRVLDEESPVHYEVSPALAAGDRTFSTMRYPHYDRTGALDGTVAICRDVTALRERDRQLRVIDRVLRHNLRNDLTAIEGFAETIRESASGEVAAHAGRIVDTAERLARTADKERKITTLLSDKPAPQPVDAVAVAESVAARARNRHPEADVSLAAPAACRVTATTALREALAELVDNAVVHSDRDAPSVAISVADEDDRVAIRVADDGPGIPEMERRVLTGATEMDPLYHGSGLGLWLVQLIVRHSDGTVEVATTEPRGSVVTIRLPAA